MNGFKFMVNFEYMHHGASGNWNSIQWDFFCDFFSSSTWASKKTQYEDPENLLGGWDPT